MKILFFDGYCSLCNEIVDWGISHDKQGTIKFASLQGEAAKRMIPPYDLRDNDSVIYWRNDIAYQRSSAILHFLGDLGWPWKTAKIFFIVPGPLRDIVYNWIARNRYRYFKKRETCRVPTPNEKARLL